METNLVVKPPLDQIINLFDIELVASKVISKEAWAYYSSGADDEVSLRENHSAFQRLWLRPRVLVNVEFINTQTKILGHNSSFPLYISSTGLAKLAHPDGQKAIIRGAYKKQIPHMCPTFASSTLEEMISFGQIGQVQFLQLYVNPNRKITEQLVKTAEAGGFSALCITVDAPQVGRREKDIKSKLKPTTPLKKDTGTARYFSQFYDSSLSWKDIPWFQSITKMPIVLKGIQSVEDALLAAKYKVNGIILSNHGGRQLDFSRSGIEILPSVMSALKNIGAQNTMEVWIDGGIRRGSDIFKAIALGAKAVGIGRPILYGLGGYGQDGVERVLDLLKEELEYCMTMMGARSIEEINSGMVCVGNLGDHVTFGKDDLEEDVYIPLKTNNSKL